MFTLYLTCFLHAYVILLKIYTEKKFLKKFDKFEKNKSVNWVHFKFSGRGYPMQKDILSPVKMNQHLSHKVDRCY